MNVFSIFARLLEATYRVWPSYGGSVILFTLIIMTALLPLTLKGTRSMLALQQLQPEMKKLQNRYKDDRQKLNEEMMKFYQENKISPLGGCIPMLIQLPVFWILYETLLGLTRRQPYAADMGASLACHAGGSGSMCSNGIVPSAGYFDPKYLGHTSKLFLDLSSTRKMVSSGLDLALSPLKAMGSGLGHGWPYLLMVLVVIATAYIQQVQIQKRTPADSINPTQQMTMKIMPVAMGVIYLVIPAGVVVYFLVSNLFRIGQQALVTRTVYAPAGALTTTAREADDSGIGEKKKKSFKDNFVPGGDSLPRVGKRAAAAAPKGDATKKAASDKGKSSSTGGTPKSKVTPPKTAASRGGTAPTRQRPAPPQNRSKKK